MRKILYAASCLLLAVGAGCALTDYPWITDTNPNPPGPNIIVNGNSHILETPFIYAINTGQGWFSNHWFLNQTPSGDHTIRTMLAGPDTDFNTAVVDHKYCDPLANSLPNCEAFVATDPPGGGPGLPIPDCAFNGTPGSCAAGYASLLFYYCGERTYGECGMDKLTTADILQVANMGRVGSSMGMEGLFLDFNARNLTIVIDNNAGNVSTIPVRGTATFFFSPKKRMGWFDITNPLLSSTARAYADFLANYETNGMTATLIYNGISKTMHFKAAGGAARVQEAINKAF